MTTRNERIKALRDLLIELKGQRQKLSELSPIDTEGWSNFYDQHEKEYQSLDRQSTEVTRELRKLEWPDQIDARLYRSLKIAGFETWKDVVAAYRSHGIFWFKQFRNIGPVALEIIERIARNGGAR